MLLEHTNTPHVYAENSNDIHEQRRQTAASFPHKPQLATKSTLSTTAYYI